MRKPGGYFTVTCDDGVREFDTTTCAHCNGITIVKPKANPEDIGGLCKLCMKLICARCTARGRCDPFEEKLKRIEARGAALRSYGIAA